MSAWRGLLLAENPALQGCSPVPDLSANMNSWWPDMVRIPSVQRTWSYAEHPRCYSAVDKVIEYVGSPYTLHRDPSRPSKVAIGRGPEERPLEPSVAALLLEHRANVIWFMVKLKSIYIAIFRLNWNRYEASVNLCRVQKCPNPWKAVRRTPLLLANMFGARTYRRAAPLVGNINVTF